MGIRPDIKIKQYWGLTVCTETKLVLASSFLVLV